ncbi:MAG: hypothetical protein ABEJ74_03940 [Haloferacaceae archaeon]
MDERGAEVDEPPETSDEETVPCPVCGTESELIESATYRNPNNLTVDKIVYEGEARWVEFDDELVYRSFWCPHCECELRQVEWDGVRETPMMDPTCDPA